MKRSLRNLVMTALGLGFLTAPSLAWAQTVSVVPRVFVGTIYQAGDDDSWFGSLTASNPTCTLTVPTNHPGGVEEGLGPNGSLLLTGSSECPGMFELFLSNGNPLNALPGQGGIGNNTGVYGGTFAIVNTTDFSQQGQTVFWAGNYTQLFNIDPRGGFDCGTLTFCANAVGGMTFNGVGLSYLLELNGFTWNVQSPGAQRKK